MEGRRADRATAALVAFLLPAWSCPAASAIAVEDRPPAPGELIEVGGHRLHLDCRGSGVPTVVFDAGLGGSSLEWSLVLPEVAGFTRACAYDRAGYAWSDPGPLPRNADNIIYELRELLGNGRVPAPYVLVGHSFGGLIVQRFARENADSIAGLVLVDATHEEQFRRLQALMNPKGELRWSLVMPSVGQTVPEGLPDDVRRLAAAFSATTQTIVVTRSELNFLRRDTGSAAPGVLPDVPLVVISHHEPVPVADGRQGRMAEAWIEMQRDLATLTRHSRHVIAGTRDHHVHVREPQTVIDAVHGVVAEWRQER